MYSGNVVVMKASDESYVALDRYMEPRRTARDGFENIIGSSTVLGGVLDQIRTVAPTDSTVLIHDELV